MARPKKENALSPSQRQARYKERMNRFGIKRQYFRASETERELIRRIMVATGIESKDELLLTAVRGMGRKHGITLSSIKRDLECQKQSQKTS